MKNQNKIFKQFVIKSLKEITHYQYDDEDLSYYNETIEDDQRSLNYYKKLTIKEAAKLASDEYRASLRKYKYDLEAYKRKEEKRINLRTLVLKWNPPTKDHAFLKRYMLTELGDKVNYKPKKPIKETPETWLKVKIKCLTDIVDLSIKENKKREEGIKKQKKWNDDLMKSLK